MLDIVMLVSNLVFLFIGYHFGRQAVCKDNEEDNWVEKVIEYRKTKQEEMEAFISEE